MNEYTNVKPNDVKTVSVLNYGLFIAVVILFYSYKGKAYYYSNYSLTLFKEFIMNVPSEAINVTLIVKGVDIIEERLIINNLYPVAEDACFVLYGVSFNPQYKQIPCTGSGVIKNILPQGIIVPPENINNNISSKCNDECLCIDAKYNINSLQNNNCNIEIIRVESKDIY